MGTLGTVTVPKCKIRMIVVLRTNKSETNTNAQNSNANVTIDILCTATDPNPKIRNMTKNSKRIFQSKLQTCWRTWRCSVLRACEQNNKIFLFASLEIGLPFRYKSANTFQQVVLHFGPKQVLALYLSFFVKNIAVGIFDTVTDPKCKIRMIVTLY